MDETRLTGEAGPTGEGETGTKEAKPAGGAGPASEAAPGLHADILQVPERVIVAPAPGVFRSLAPEVVTSEGELIATGQAIGTITCTAEEVRVLSPHAGFLMGLLASDGERVRAGQPVAWARVVA